MTESRVQRLRARWSETVADQGPSGEASGIVTVRMGEIALATGGETIRTLLGSCIGIALHDSRSKIGGLAHVVLPSSRGHSGPPGKFVDTAIPELIRLLDECGGEWRNLTAKIAGGARMFATSANVAIGEHNLAAIERELADRRIPILSRHCGGKQGRRMNFTPCNGRVSIEIVGSDSVEI